MRALVLARDGHPCGTCGSTEHLMAHHLRSLAKGGRTCFENLLTSCQESVHSGTLIIRIRDGRVTGYDVDGDEIRPPGDPARVLIADQEHAFSAIDIKERVEESSDKNTELADRSAPRDPQAPPPPPAAPRIKDLPEKMTAVRFRKLQPLLDWDASRKGFVLHHERRVHEEHEPKDQPNTELKPEAERAAEPDPAAPAATAAPPASSPACPETPPRLADVVGQKGTVEWLGICAKAASKTGEPMPHTLLTGPEGLGKTRIARLVASEMGVRFTETTATTIRRPRISSACW